MEKTVCNVQCFDQGEWDTGTGMAQLRIGKAILVLVREGTQILPLVVGSETMKVQYHWRKFVEAGKFDHSKFPLRTLDDFLEFYENQ